METSIEIIANSTKQMVSFTSVENQTYLHLMVDNLQKYSSNEREFTK